MQLPKETALQTDPSQAPEKPLTAKVLPLTPQPPPTLVFATASSPAIPRASF
jgi:hypothetical protein